jgi:hypothetical protein
MATIQGHFYFRQTDAGNLLGEYAHNETVERSLPESALRLPNQDSAGVPFLGKYKSTWYEPDPGNSDNKDQSVTADLEIRLKGSASSKLYTLAWTDPTAASGAEPMFTGEAMLCGGLLIGSYSD